MGYKIGVLTLHGMGAQKIGYSAKWKANIMEKLSPRVCKEVVFEEAYYQDIMQREQRNLWENRLDWQTKSLCPLKLVVAFGIAVWVAALVIAAISNWGVVDSLALALGLTVLTFATVFAVVSLSARVWVRLRQLVLFYLSDPATYAYRQRQPGSVYRQVHDEISRSLKSLCEKLDDDGCVVVVAHSLGAHVLSNHIWDAQSPLRSNDDVARAALLESDDYQCIQRIVRVLTAAPNITLFVAGFPKVQPFAKPSKCFEWHSFYDKDDVLGWQLRPLPPGDDSSYRDLVTVECRINVGGCLKSWNPASHTEYFGRGTKFIKHVAKEIEELHQRTSRT